MRTVLVTGARGMLGTEVVEALTGTAEVVAADLKEFDVTDRDAVDYAVRRIAPDVIVNCAAYTDVDGAEAERELAFSVNADAAGNLARAALAAEALLVHVSTDYVFDGSKDGAYLEDDEPCPANVYGESKLAGERFIRSAGGRHLIVRTAWLYGHAGRNFVETILSLAEKEQRLRIVDDQIGAPTNARDLAVMLKELVPTGATGILNATNSGSCSWYEFGREILRAAGLESVAAEPVGTDTFPRPARRPTNSVLSLERLCSLLGWVPRHWTDAVSEYIGER